METISRYWLPMVPMTVVDIVNRRAAATGSIGYAMAAGGADYNGHQVTVSFKPHAVSGPTWNAEYWWAGRCVLARGSLERCADAAADYMQRRAAGAVVYAYVDERAPESVGIQKATLLALGFRACPDGTDKLDKQPWFTPAHHAVYDALSWERDGLDRGPFAGMTRYAMQYSGTVEDWPAARDAWIDDRQRERMSRQTSRVIGGAK